MAIPVWSTPRDSLNRFNLVFSRCPYEESPLRCPLFLSILLARLRGLEGLDQHRGDLEQVAADAVVGDLEDRRGVVLVDRDDALGLAHTGLVLDGAGDTKSNVDLRVDGLTLSLIHI